MSMDRLFAVLFAAVTLLVGPAVLAQDAGWEVVAISGLGGQQELLTISADGIERTELSPDFPASYEQLALSPDGSLLVTIPARWNRVVVANLADGECCTELSFTDEDVFLTTLAGFSPDGTKLALSYVIEEPAESAMLTLDVATGEIVDFVDTTETNSSDSNVLYYPVLTEWRDDGIHYVTSCIYCVDAAMPNQMSVWDPSIYRDDPVSEWYDYRSDRLDEVDATVQAVFALDYPSAADAESIFWGAEEFGVRNAVVLTGELAENGNAVVYSTAEHSNLIPRWVADGSAILVMFNNDPPGAGVVVLPDGSLIEVAFPFTQFLAGTPDGWLGKAGGVVTHYQIVDGDIVSAELGEFSGSLALVQAAPLGAESASAFATFSPPEPVTCPGFVASRMQVGHLGRVLPGPANNMRDEASTTGTIIAKIAGAEPFAILEGPVCNQGLAWWRVEFNHQEGWTAEGSGTSYWLEQAPENGYRAPAPE